MVTYIRQQQKKNKTGVVIISNEKQAKRWKKAMNIMMRPLIMDNDESYDIIIWMQLLLYMCVEADKILGQSVLFQTKYSHRTTSGGNSIG